VPSDYDLIAIGAGSGGLSVVERAAAHGARCALIESGRIGGTCVNRGCVPKKVMWYGAMLGHQLRYAHSFGFDIERKGFDWSELKRRREEYVQGINDWYHTYLADSDIDEIKGRARFVDPRTVEVNGERYSADHIVIAVGGAPLVPGLPGVELGITSDGFFELDTCPRRVAVVGAGYIAVELAGMLNAFGAEVSLMLRKEQLLRSFDSMLRDTLMESMLNDGINIYPLSGAAGLVRENDRITLVSDQGDRMADLDAVIWAIGRHPVTAELALEVAGVATDEMGFIPTDDYQRTNVEGIYAVGDVTGRYPLTPVAIAAGRRLGDRLFGTQSDRHLSYENIPTVVFAHPPLGSVGLTEEQARLRHGDAVKIYQNRFTPLLHAISGRNVPSAMKLVVVGARERLVGCHIIGEGADEILQGFAVALRMGAAKKDLDDTVAIHPTSAEELVTLR
jgi:glutathione reductase (NADPH)